VLTIKYVHFWCTRVKILLEENRNYENSSIA
jgi:hypothetical protein